MTERMGTMSQVNVTEMWTSGDWAVPGVVVRLSDVVRRLDRVGGV